MPATLYLGEGREVDLTRSLGEGSFGRVFEVKSEQQQQQETIGKPIPPAMPLVAKIISLKKRDGNDSFMRETEAYRALHAYARRTNMPWPHPNIVQYLGHDQERALGVILLERLPGMTLEKFMAAAHPNGLPVARVVTIASGILCGLETLHAAGISLRDLKPENIHYDEATGTVKLFDLGFAVRVEPGEMRSYYTGSPMYMAPECVQQRRHDSKAFDMWSFGQVVYYLATGHAAFHYCKTMDELKMAIKARAITYPDTMHASLRFFIDRLLAYNPATRWTAGMARVGLQCLAQGGMC